MTHWVDTYPHDVYASVLLLDGKIYNYKIGQNHWEYPYEVKMRYSDFWKIDRMQTQYVKWTVEDDEQHSQVFTEYARHWFKNWEIHEDHIGRKAY